MNIQITRIKRKFHDVFGDKIDMSDLKEKIGTEDYEKNYLSRCLAAYSLMIISDISMEDAAASITDGFHDNGIDAIFKDENGKQLILVQSKWVSDGNGTISQGDTLKYISGVEKLMCCQYEEFNEKIQKKQQLINSVIESMDYQFRLVIVYTSNNPIAKECSDELQKLLNRTNDEINELLSYEIIGLSKIYETLANDSLNAEIILDDFPITEWGIMEDGERQRGYYGLVSAEYVAKCWNKYGNSLLAKNIRFFKGDTEVNNGMKRNLESRPELFCFYNNGIKMVAKKVTKKLLFANDRKMGVFCLEGASVVNGAQTTGCIGTTYESNPEAVARAKVMIQIISLENESEEFGEDITKLSNTQNKIESKAFASMDPFHERIARDLRIDGFEYAYKEGDIRKNDKICNIDEATIALGCYLGDVTIVTTIKREVGSIFENINKAPYKTIFNDGVNAYLLWNTIMVYRSMENSNVEYQNNNTGIDKLISIHGNRFLLYLIFKDLKKEKKDLSKEYVKIDDELIKQKLVDYISSIKKIKEKEYQEAYTANIFKNANRCKDIERRLLAESD